MSPAEFYDEIALSFPALWPSSPEWTWVNIHDGTLPKVNVISEMLDRVLTSSEVVVLVHSQPGEAVTMSRESAAGYVSQFVLKHDIQVADPERKLFVSITCQGVATGDA